jgi:hypothetical protein
MLHFIPSITSFEEEINANNITNNMASLSTSNNPTETATVAPSPVNNYLFFYNLNLKSFLYRVIRTIHPFLKDGNKEMIKMDAFTILITQRDEQLGSDLLQVLGL